MLFRDLAVFPARARDRSIESQNNFVFWKYFRRNTSSGNTCVDKVIIWSEIVLISILWRIALCRLFSIPTLRALYRKYEIEIERLFGALLILLGWRMAGEVGRSVPGPPRHAIRW